MKKFLLIVIIAILMALSFPACSAAPVPLGEGNARAHNNDGTFEINIYTDKQEYKQGEPVICYATVEYVGGEDGIVVYGSEPLVYFTLKGGKYFDGDYMVHPVLKTTEFKKGVPVTYEYEKSGGWSSDDPNADFYEQFYSEEQLILPPGEYEISVVLDGIFDQNDYEGSKYSLSAAVSIRVE